jgi:hypothetical protein
MVRWAIARIIISYHAFPTNGKHRHCSSQ